MHGVKQMHHNGSNNWIMNAVGRHNFGNLIKGSRN